MRRILTLAALAVLAAAGSGTAQSEGPATMGDPYQSSMNFVKEIESGTCGPALWWVVAVRTPETRGWARASARYWFFRDRTKPVDENEERAFLLRVSMYERHHEWDAYFVDTDRDGYVDEEFWSTADFRLKYKNLCAAWYARGGRR